MNNEVRLAVIAGALSFAGAIGGTLVSSFLEERRDRSKFQLEFYSKMLDKRLAVVERCTTSRSLTARARDLKKFSDAENERLISTQKEGKGLPDPTFKYFSYEMQKELTSILSEYFSCIQMGSTLFGPKTAAAVRVLNESPERLFPDEKSRHQNAVFQAMFDELSVVTPVAGGK